MRPHLIEELKLRQGEITQKMKDLEEELDRYAEEADSIEMLLDQYGAYDTPKAKIKKAPIGIPKGDLSWDDYAIEIIRQKGGRVKSSEAIEYGKAANPRIKEKTIKDTLRGSLSKLGGNGTIGVEKAAIKSEGNVYFIK